VQVLVVDDDPLTRRLVRFILTDEGYDVAAVGSGSDAFAFIESTSVDVFILDVVMPHVDGFEVCRRLREVNPDAGILFLTGRSDLDARVAGLNLGADDYLTKPFEPEELVARVSVLARRHQRQRQKQQQSPPSDELRVGNVALHVADLQVAITTSRGTELVHLTPTEARLLRRLMTTAGQVVSNGDLLVSIWGDAATRGGTQAVAVYIRRLRAKLALEGGEAPTIELVWGSGYRFVTP